LTLTVLNFKFITIHKVYYIIYRFFTCNLTCIPIYRRLKYFLLYIWMIISRTEPKSTTCSKDYYYVSIINQGRRNERKCNFTKTTIIIEWMDLNKLRYNNLLQEMKGWTKIVARKNPSKIWSIIKLVPLELQYWEIKNRKWLQIHFRVWTLNDLDYVFFNNLMKERIVMQ
jgi:hypothetical protein